MTRNLALALAAIVLLGLMLRVYHLRNPIIDHPAWRQGDEAAIARNFVELRNNIFYPQVDYDGPPPNYVELELQIVPFAAAQLYRVFGAHEVFGRLLVIAFSLGTIPLIFALGSELYSRRAGLIAALLFAITPGVVYYGRAIIPESDMLFFSCDALLFWWRWLARGSAPDWFLTCGFAALAWLAKPPALLLLFPMLALAAVKMRECSGATLRRARSPLVSSLALVAVSMLPFFFYFSHLRGIAEWHWASGITAKHVVPNLAAEFASPALLLAGLQSTLALGKMLATTILGPALFGLVLLAAFAQPPTGEARARAVFFGAWLAALCAYAFAVVNVERVDYYLLPFVPFAVLYAAGALDHVLGLLAPQGLPWRTKTALAAATFFAAYINMLEVHAYYTWSRPVFAAAAELRQTLEPNTLIVMGHYDPSVLYAIGRRGWEEDVLLWNVHDMTSAIAKGARYFVAIEVPRLRANKSLYHFMQRYRRVPVRSGWQVYDMHHFAARPAAGRIHVR